MNWNQIQGDWRQFTSHAREKWNRLAESDFTQIAGNRDRLVDRIQETYGIAKEDAEQQVREFEKSLH